MGGTRGAIRSLAICASAAAAILISVPGSITPGHAALQRQRYGRCCRSGYETGKDLLTSQCAAMAPNPGFWALVAAILGRHHLDPTVARRLQHYSRGLKHGGREQREGR